MVIRRCLSLSGDEVKLYRTSWSSGSVCTVAMPHRCIENDDRPCWTTREDSFFVSVLWTVHHLTRLSRLQMRPRQKAGSTVLGVKSIDHQDATEQGPPIGAILDVYMKPFRWCARIERSRAHAAQFEWFAYHLAASSQQGRVDIDHIKLRSSIDEVIYTRRRPGLAGVHISRVGSSDVTIIGIGELFAAATNDRAGHNNEADIAQLSGGVRRQIR